MKKLASLLLFVTFLAFIMSSYGPGSSPAATLGVISPQEMARILTSVEVPTYDLADWLARLGMLSRPVPRTVLGPPPSYAVGDIEDFFFVDEATWEVQTVPAELRYITDHAYMWVEMGADVDQTALAKAAERFENEIYPTDRDYFGEEWSPGVDNDPHISILHLTGLGGAGEFGSDDEYTADVSPDSNQREMFYVNLDEAIIGDDDYLATLAHEFQHMIQWKNEGNEANWLDEGLAQLAERLAGFDTVENDMDFLKQSHTQLNAWAEDWDDELRYYGAAYLYVLYLWERLGDDVVRTLARHPSEGLASVNATLAEQGLDLTADDLFADWIVANYLDDPTLADGRYGYQFETLGPICPRQRYTTLPVQQVKAIPQYAADYVEIEGQGEFAIDFKGAIEAPLIPTQAHSGQSFWWSNRGDDADMTLTRAFDLSSLEEATLQFWTWYDIQETLDFAYVEVSNDGGKTWDILGGKHTVYDPEVDYGPNYTGVSGKSDEPQWVMEEMDLSPYVGQEILLCFEYTTETWFTGPGFALDDIAIPELAYTYDAEPGDDGWEGAGFVRTSNAIPQNWALQLVTLGDGVSVQRLDVAEDGTAHAEVTLGDGVRKAALIIGAMAPVTKEEARFELQITGELTGTPPLALVEADVLFQDDFSDVCSGWETYSDAEVANGYADDVYFIEVKVPDTFWWIMAGQDFTDVVIKVETTQEVSAIDNSWGVLCRYQDDDNFYFFEISNDGFYTIIVQENGEYITLVDWTESGVINQGQGAPNQLTVTCDGDLLSLAVNGQILAKVRDSTFTHGEVGFEVSTFEQGGARILFDNLVVHQP